jgi:phosphate starvation-inducible membrane PsiE
MIGLLFLVLLLIGVSSWFIASRIYKGLKKSNNSYATLWGVLSFFFSFAIITAGVFFLIINNIRIER